jgi:regulatory protein
MEASTGTDRDHAPELAQRALEIAYRYLNRRERTAAEVARRLRRDGFGAEVIAQTIAALGETGAVDDARFARLFTDDKRELAQWGGERIRRALVERGIDQALASAVVDGGRELAAARLENERDRALALLRRRFPEPPRTRRDRDRALGVLLRRGYQSELALDAIAAYVRQ